MLEAGFEDGLAILHVPDGHVCLGCDDAHQVILSAEQCGRSLEFDGGHEPAAVADGEAVQCRV